MRHIDLTEKKYHVDRGLNRVYTIYDDVNEAVANGVSRQDIIDNWRFIQGYEPLIKRIEEKESVWVVSDDKFVPDYADSRERVIVPLYRDGHIVPTTGCVVEVIQYFHSAGGLTSDYFKTPTGTFSFRQAVLTTETRKNIHVFTPFYNQLGNPKRLSDKKRRAALALLNPLSPTYGRMVASFLSVYPHYKRHKLFVLRKIVLGYYSQEWFYKLIRKDWVLSMLVNDLKSEIEKRKTMNAPALAESLELAMNLAKEQKKPKDILAVVLAIKDILEKETNPSVPPPPGVAQLPTAENGNLLTPHIDGEQLAVEKAFAVDATFTDTDKDVEHEFAQALEDEQREGDTDAVGKQSTEKVGE